jgi:hypothetical protein
VFVQSLDPNRTVAHQPADVPSSETLDVTRAKTTPPANADEPPDGLPVIPGYPITPGSTEVAPPPRERKQ